MASYIALLTRQLSTDLPWSKASCLPRNVQAKHFLWSLSIPDQCTKVSHAAQKSRLDLLGMLGRKMLKSLLANGISCSYILLPAIGVVLPTVSLTILGTHAMLSNGAMFSRAGTAMVAMMSKGAGIPVICCCETYKFSDRIMLDSIVGNERGKAGKEIQSMLLI